KEGFFHFCGRRDFSFKIHGLWVSPIEIENAIIDTGLAGECCVVALSGIDGISVPIAYVVPQRDNPSKDLETSIAREIERKLTKYKVPKKFVFVDSLAKTAVGKLDRFEILRNAKATLSL
ncbi:MAG: AMP-binding enzyme, partial [Nitrososphaerales archaeon]